MKQLSSPSLVKGVYSNQGFMLHTHNEISINSIKISIQNNIDGNEI